MLTHFCALTYYRFPDLWVIGFPALALLLLALWLAAFRPGAPRALTPLKAVVLLLAAEELLAAPGLSFVLLPFLSSELQGQFYLAGLALLALSRVPWPDRCLPLRARWLNIGLLGLAFLALVISGPWPLLLAVLWSEAVGRPVHYLTTIVLVIDLLVYLAALAWWISPKRRKVPAKPAAAP